MFARQAKAQLSLIPNRCDLTLTIVCRELVAHAVKPTPQVAVTAPVDRVATAAASGTYQLPSYGGSIRCSHFF